MASPKPHGLSAAVEVAITDETIRKALLHANAASSLGRRKRQTGELPARGPALEVVAKELRRRIIEEALAAGLHEVVSATHGVQKDVTSEAESNVKADACERSEPCHRARLRVSLQDTTQSPLPTRACEVHAESTRWSEVQLGCVHCRRPLEVAVRVGNARSAPEPMLAGIASSALQATSRGGAGVVDAQPHINGATSNSTGKGGPAAATEPPKEHEAYCAVFCDNSRTAFLQALALGQSLVSSGATKERILFHSPDAPENYLDVLRHQWDLRPIPSWPKVQSRIPSFIRRSGNGLAARLFALSLAEYSKILLFELGVVLCTNPDSLFRLECPAAVLLESDNRHDNGRDPPPSSSSPPTWCRLDTSMMLLRPSKAAFRRMAAEIGLESAAWPPRGHDTGKGGPNLTEEYLLRFYFSFFGGAWMKIPSELAPVRLSDEPANFPSDVSYNLQHRGCWDALERAFRDMQVSRAPIPTHDKALRWRIIKCLKDLEDSRAPPTNSSLVRALTFVDNRRCSSCSTFDAKGTRDPIDKFWRCRFCWEEVLREGAIRDRCPPPMSAEEVEELREELGDFYTGPGRQQWTWDAGGSAGWIEFRPNGVLWTRDSGVGAWQKRGDTNGCPQIAVNLCAYDRPEARHVLSLRSSARPGKKELHEVSREILRPLGFGSRSLDRAVRCVSMATVSNPSPSCHSGSKAEIPDTSTLDTAAPELPTENGSKATLDLSDCATKVDNAATVSNVDAPPADDDSALAHPTLTSDTQVESSTE